MLGLQPTIERVTTAGTIRFKKRLVFVSHALTPHPIGLEEVDDGVWSIYFCQVLLARLDERDYSLTPLTRGAPVEALETRKERGFPPLPQTLSLSRQPSSVTHVAGIFCYPSSRSLRLGSTRWSH